MKNMIPTLMISLAMSSPLLVYADSSKEHGKTSGPGEMMSQHQMMGMQEHMQSMQEMMKNLKQESNPEKRGKLIDAHMQAMQKGMMMMSGDENEASMPMDQRMDMMNKHMNMMQMMMGQMMDSRVEERKSRSKHLKR